MLKKKVWRPFAHAVVLITLLAAALFAWALIRVDILPEKYLLAFFATEAAVLGVSALLLYGGMKRKPSGARRARRVLGLALCILLVAGNVLASSVLMNLNRTRVAIGGRRDRVAVLGVYVLRDDTAQTLADTAGYRYGVLGGFEKGNSDYALSRIEDELGAAPSAEEFAAIAEAASALRGGEVRALAVNENHLELLSESETLGGFAEEIRLIERIEVPLAEASSGTPGANGAGSDGAGAHGLIGSLLPSKPTRTDQLSTGEKIERDRCVVFYLSGNDSETTMLSNGRSDVNILMIVNPETDQILLVNTPRDYYVPNPALGRGMDKLTHCGLFGTYNSMAALEELYGVEIDNYCQINFTGFEKLIDTLGGVTLDNPRPFYSGYGYYFPEGEITLDGQHALAYGRERESFGDGDIQRGRNLMRLIAAMVDKVKSSGASMLMNYPAVLDSLEGMFATDLSADEISALAKLALRDLSSWEVKSTTVSGSGGMMPTAAGGDRPLYVMWPDSGEVARASGLIEKVLSGERIDGEELG